MERPAAARTFVGHAVAARVLARMLEQAADPAFSDLRVRAGGKDFPCHRAVLAASSPVFAAMCQSRMREPASGELTLSDVSADVFAAVRAYLYGRPLQVCDDHALALSSFVRRYEIAAHELPDFLDSLLTSALMLENVLSVRHHADAHGSHRLRRNCDRFITARMKILPETESFLESELTDACAALRAPNNVSRDVAGRKCGQYVLAAAVAWLLHDEIAREAHRDEVLAAVDVEGLSLPALVRASRDVVASKSAPFQARLLRAFASKAERDLNFGPLTGRTSSGASVRGEARFAVANEPTVLRREIHSDGIGLLACPPPHAFYGARRPPTLPYSVHPRLPHRYPPSTPLSHEQGGTSTSSEADER